MGVGDWGGRIGIRIKIESMIKTKTKTKIKYVGWRTERVVLAAEGRLVVVQVFEETFQSLERERLFGADGPQ